MDTNKTTFYLTFIAILLLITLFFFSFKCGVGNWNTIEAQWFVGKVGGGVFGGTNEMCQLIIVNKSVVPHKMWH